MTKIAAVCKGYRRKEKGRGVGKKGQGLYFPFMFSPILLHRFACSCCAGQGQTTNSIIKRE